MYLAELVCEVHGLCVCLVVRLLPAFNLLNVMLEEMLNWLHYGQATGEEKEKEEEEEEGGGRGGGGRGGDGGLEVEEEVKAED